MNLYRDMNSETQYMVRRIIGSLHRTDKELHRLQSQMKEGNFTEEVAIAALIHQAFTGEFPEE